jgi:hypothetical protein
MSNLDKAIEIALNAHADQVDKAGHRAATIGPHPINALEEPPSYELASA